MSAESDHPHAVTPDARIKDLATDSNVDVNPTLKVMCYVRSLKEIVRCAENYYEEGNLEIAYVLYLRYLTLALEKIKEHPGFKELAVEHKKEMNGRCKQILPIAEKIKTSLLSKFQTEYEAYEKAVKLQQEQEKREEEERQIRILAAAKPIPNYQSFAATAPPPPYSSVTPATTTFPDQTIKYEFGIDDSSISNGSNKVSPTNNITSTQPMQYPQVDRTSKPSRLLSPMGTGSLRTVVIPGDLTSKFISLSNSNTLKNIETCGVLCGKIMREKLVITHLVIPKQTGTADSCLTLHEEEIYKIMDSYSLIQIGWIHTHPSQTSFLSSVDLHTHLSYQLMMPESIAIVCAPSKQEVDVFTLTPLGMESLQKCADSGFHPHPQLDGPYFTNASHTTYDPNRQIIVQDLRY